MANTNQGAVSLARNGYIKMPFNYTTGKFPNRQGDKYTYLYMGDMLTAGNLAKTKGKINKDEFWHTEAAPPVATAATNVNPLVSFQANHLPVTGYTQFMLNVYTNVNQGITHPDYTNLLVVGNSYVVTLPVTEGMGYTWTTYKDGNPVSFESNLITVEVTGFYATAVSLGIRMARMNETEGTVWTFSSGPQGAYVPTFNLNQPGLFSSFADPAVRFNNGYAKKNANTDGPNTPINLNAQEFLILVVFRLNNTSGNVRVGGYFNDTVNNGNVNIATGAAGSNLGRVFLQSTTGAIIASVADGGNTQSGNVDFNITGMMEINKAKILVLKSTIESSKHILRTYYKANKDTAALKVSQIAYGNDNLTINNFAVGAKTQLALGSYADVNVMYAGEIIAATLPAGLTESAILALMDSGTLYA